VQLNAGTTGTLSASAGMLPPRPLWLVATSAVASSSLLAGRAPSSRARFFAHRACPHFPRPVYDHRQPQAPLGDAAFTFARTLQGLYVHREQIGSSTVGDRTLTIPRTALTFTSTSDGGGTSSGSSGYNIKVQGEQRSRCAIFGLSGVDLKRACWLSSHQATQRRCSHQGFGRHRRASR
jgi:hypothetical protein